MAEEKKRAVGEDMGPKLLAKDKYSKEISTIWAAVRGSRPKAMFPVSMLDEIPNKYLPASVAEFMYGLREDRDKYKGTTKYKADDVVEVSAGGVCLKDKDRKPLKEARYSQNPEKQKAKLKKAK